MTVVYLVWYEIQEYDDSDALDSIWSTREGAQRRLDEMDIDSAASIKQSKHYAYKISSESGWSIVELQMDKGGARW